MRTGNFSHVYSHIHISLLWHWSKTQMHTNYEYVALVIHYFKGHDWKDAVVKGSCIYTSKNAEVNISTMNLVLKFVIPLYCALKARRNFPLTLSHSLCCSKSLAAIISSIRPRCLVKTPKHRTPEHWRSKTPKGHDINYMNPGYFTLAAIDLKTVTNVHVSAHFR